MIRRFWRSISSRRARTAAWTSGLRARSGITGYDAVASAQRKGYARAGLAFKGVLGNSHCRDALIFDVTLGVSLSKSQEAHDGRAKRRRRTYPVAGPPTGAIGATTPCCESGRWNGRVGLLAPLDQLLMRVRDHSLRRRASRAHQLEHDVEREARVVLQLRGRNRDLGDGGVHRGRPEPRRHRWRRRTRAA